MKLYQLSAELASILERDDDGEMNDEDCKLLDGLLVSFEDKVESVLKARSGIISEKVAVLTEIGRLKARAERLDRKAEWLSDYVFEAMQHTGVGRLTTPTFNATIATAPPKVNVANDLDPTELSAKYVKVKTETTVDKAAVLEAFKCGEPLPMGLTVTQGKYLKVS